MNSDALFFGVADIESDNSGHIKLKKMKYMDPIKRMYRVQQELLKPKIDEIKREHLQ